MNITSSTRRVVALVAALLILSACATSHVLVGTPRPPISPTEVKVYMKPPARYEQIAQIESSSRASWTFTAQGKTDKLIERMKEEAAKLGANGILIQGIGDRPGGSIGLGFGGVHAGGNSATGVGVGGSGTTYQKAGSAMAIFVTQE
jgi:hypothetical protein